ncbi:MAG TPA: TIGR03943 family protein [Anaerolineales bacterium]
MLERRYRFFQAVIFLGLFLFLVTKLINTQLLWYINKRFIILTEIGILLLAILMQRLFMEARSMSKPPQDEEHVQHEHKPAAINLWILSIPLLIGVLIPAKPLDSTAVSAKGLTTTSALISSNSSSRPFETESEQRNVLAWVKLFYFEKDLTPYTGQKASVIGFVYLDDRLPKGQFFVSRFILACCAADAYAVGMIVEPPAGTSIKQDEWLQVKGPVEVVSFDGHNSPLIRAETITPVSQPDQPYLYP